MSVLETLADGRKLFRIQQADRAADFQAGLSLVHGGTIWPVMRRDGDALWVVGHRAPEGELAWCGEALAVPDTDHPVLCCEDDQFFAVLAWLFAQSSAQRQRCTVLVGFKAALPFRPQPSKFLTPQLPAHVTAAVPLLEDWNVLSRIAHPDGLPGCFDGPVQKLATHMNANARQSQSF